MEQRPDSSKASGSIIYILALVIALAIIGVGVYLVIEQKTWALLAAGAASVVAVLVTWPLAMGMNAPQPVQPPRYDPSASNVADRLQEIVVLLNLMKDQQLLSDRAKTVAFREKDREALRRAIKEDLVRRDWEAALVLVNDMERTFGYANEAVQFRQEINAHRDEVVRRDVAETTTKVENLCRQEKWTEALREAERVVALYPDNEAAQRLASDIDMRRQSTKKQLMENWNEAITRKDIDGAIEILKKLDLYLTRPEAEGIQESVRGVFREKVNQLGAQFMLAWQDHKYPEALRIAEIINRDFPNSGIAREVRDKMAVLRERAGGAPQAEVARV